MQNYIHTTLNSCMKLMKKNSTYALSFVKINYSINTQNYYLATENIFWGYCGEKYLEMLYIYVAKYLKEINNTDQIDYIIRFHHDRASLRYSLMDVFS